MGARQRMMFSGPSALSNAELLSLMIGTGTDKANEVLSYADSISDGLGVMEVRELTAIDGIGNSKACSIVAAMELSKRLTCDASHKKNRTAKNAGDIARILMEDVANEKRELFMVVGLNSKLAIEWKEIISIGSLNSAPVHPREVFRPAIRRSSAAICVAHNHPSGDVTPSAEDIELTKRLVRAADIVGIKLIDHVIIANGGYLSMKTEGMMD